MEDNELKRGYRNAWILSLLLIALVVVWTWFTVVTNQDEVPPHFEPGVRAFVPGESVYGVGYQTTPNTTHE